jgi:hypothetical protein
MRELLRDIRYWLVAVLRKWIWLLGGAAATLAQWVWHPTAQALRSVAVVCVVVAVFLAWRDEHRKVGGVVDHERREAQQRLRALATSMVQQYIAWSRPAHDSGPHPWHDLAFRRSSLTP